MRLPAQGRVLAQVTEPGPERVLARVPVRALALVQVPVWAPALAWGRALARAARPAAVAAWPVRAVQVATAA